MKFRFFVIVSLLVMFVHGLGFGEESADTWYDLGVEYYNKGDYAKSIECFLKEKDIIEKTLGKEHPDYATSLNHLGDLYRTIGNYAAAEIYLLESLAITEQVLGKEHPQYAGSLNDLGLLYYTMENLCADGWLIIPQARELLTVYTVI